MMIFVYILLVCTVLLVGPADAVGSCRESRLCCPGRDSSCVVQKTPINAIIEDLSDKPCYCDHACLKLGDCCEDFKDACGVVDCTVSPWGSWSECDSECGTGTMMRERHVVREPENGGRHCPALTQHRGCQGTRCNQQGRRPIKETAMLLPASLSASRKVNATSDIRRNLRLRYPKDHPQREQRKEYCVKFEVMKSTKECREQTPLKEGQYVCVLCEQQAQRKALGYRCPGHGVDDRATRWSLFSPICRGKWVRVEYTEGSDCPCDNGADYIFV